MFKRDTKKDKKKKAADRITNGKRKLKGAMVHSAGKSSLNKVKLSYSEHREAKASARSRNTSTTATGAISGRRREEKHGKSHKGAGQQRSSFRMKLPTQYNDGQGRGSRGGLLPQKQHQRFNTTRDNLQPPWYNAELIERFRCNSTDTGNNNFAHNTSTTPTRSVNAPPPFSSLSMLQQQQQLLPSEHILQQLDVEIQAFVSYVRLSNTEQVARWGFVQHVTDICQRQFTTNNYNNNSNSSSNSNRSSPRHPDNGGGRQRDYYYDNNKRGWKSSNINNNDNFNNNNKQKVAETAAAAADNAEVVRVIPFGSFMTLDVCTFESDVDMCLWGVVSPNEFDEDDDNCKSSTLLKKSRSNKLQTSIENSVSSSGRGGCPLLTESSLLRTMDAIQTSTVSSPVIEVGGRKRKEDQTTIDDQQQQRKQLMTTTTKKKKSKRSSSSVTNNDNDNDADNTAVIEQNDDLFFIDRVGDQAAAIIDLCNDDDDDDDNVTTHSAVVTTTTSSSTTSSSSTTINNSSIEEEEEIIEQIIMTQEMIERITKKKSNSSTMTIQNSSAITCATTAVATASSSSTNMAEDFQFVIDKEGFKEFGGYNDEEEEKEKSEGVIDNLLDPTITQQSNLGQTDECDALSSSAVAVVATENDLTIDGKSQRGTFVERNDDGSYVVAIDDGNDNIKDSDDDDSADKLSSYYQRHSNRHDDVTTTTAHTKPSSLSSVICLDNDDTSDDENQYLENDSSDRGSSSEDGNVDDTDNKFSTPTAATTTTATRRTREVMELSVTSNANNIQSQATAVVGPRGKTRTRVVSTLLCLTRQLRLSSHYVHTIECRTKARVPIINCATRMGFEGDIAIGGHNGVDTSMYAQAQSTRYRSFAPVVVVLKIIMSQQGLDKPFTGGLGSYKLYVLVAYHIEQHLALGGNDRPSEILISLLIRYGGGSSGGSHHRTNRGNTTTTDLEKLKTRDEVLRCDGGTVELTPVFRLTDCVDMFHECYDRLLLSNTTSTDEAHMSARKTAIASTSVPSSYLSRIIDCHRLKEARETSERRSRMSENSSNSSRSQYSSSSTVIPSPHTNLNDDNDNRRKVLGGQLKRGPRGGIIPKYRPDLMAATAAATTNQQDLNLLQRATKNRKNNKKQKRDAVVKEYASAYINDDNIFR